MLCTGAPGSTEAPGAPVRVGASGGYLSTRLRFGDGTTGDLVEGAYALSVEVRPSPGVGLMVSPGGVLGGSLTVEGTRYRLSPGPLLGLGVTWRVVDPAQQPFFLLFGASLSASHLRSFAGSEAASLTSFDARASLVAGKTFFEFFSPYAAVRAFGGPIFWGRAGASVTGTDAYHYNVGAGFSLTLPGGVDVFADGAPLGERRLSLGAGKTF